MELKFQTFCGRIRETLNSGGLEDSVRVNVRSDCERTTTFLFNITSIIVKNNFPYQVILGRKPKLSTSLRIFGEMSVVTTKYEIYLWYVQITMQMISIGC
jgi:hypothetical protein